jgi:imidazoleglycerol phosphate synthase glutamine amidotransferase subunit HisH
MSAVLLRSGATSVKLTTDPSLVRAATHVVLPGTLSSSSRFFLFYFLSTPLFMCTYLREHVGLTGLLHRAGVGSFGSAMDFLSKADGLIAALKDRIANNQPTLCVCVGYR